MDELKCIVVECEKKQKQQGYCSMHIARLQRTGRIDKKTSYERLMERVSMNDNGCWCYTRYLNSYGYGRLRVNGKKMLAHRLSYLMNKGNIPDDMFVLHTCNNPACVNPAHLYIGDACDNANDMVKQKRQWLQRAKEQGLKFNMRGGVFPDGYKRIR